MKTNSELFDLLTDPKMFDSAVELVAEFKTFKDDLLKKFWMKLFETFQNSEKLSQWRVESDISANSDLLFIYFVDKNDINGEIYFMIYYKTTLKNHEFIFGVGLNFESERIADYDVIYEGAKKI